MESTLFLGQIALCLALVAAFLQTMPALRLAAMAACIATMAAGYAEGAAWLWIGAGLVLIVHLWRYAQARATLERLTSDEAPSPAALFAFVNRETLEPGRILFKRGDAGAEMYLIVEGEIEIVELGKTLGAGAVLGEVALVVPSHKRTATARAKSNVTLARMTKRDMELTALQNPTFGFELLKLVARRLSDDVDRLERRIADGA
jgi:CRP/FNR family transcriptional regulator, cyclic AMP receptor protein